MSKPLYYAKKCCDTMMKTFKAEDLPPKGDFHYHQGVFLSGMLNTYKKCNEEKYFNYIKDWVDSVVAEDGSIPTLRTYMLDDIQPGILLFELAKRTDDTRYQKALKLLVGIIKQWPCNPEGGFWHKLHHKNETWLDSLYMAGQIQAQYSAEYGCKIHLDVAIKQAMIMYNKMLKKDTNLLCHAWDYYKCSPWADPETGCSPEVWGRALGWYVVAILDILEFTPESHPKRQTLIDIERKTLEAVLKYRDTKTGMWYQVVDKGELEDNWLESSCSSLFTYSMARAYRMGICDRTYLEASKDSFEGIIKHSVDIVDDEIRVKDICIGTDVGTYKEYIERPTCVNDLHGTGAFLLMCAELIGA